jgi:murein DD-endopeptidase MepM/ murein hydrolase activator NlpD
MLRRFALLLVLCALLCGAAAARPPDGGRALTSHESGDQLTPESDRAMVDAVAGNLAALKASGRFTPQPQALTNLIWPLAPSPGPGADWYAIVNFVDLDPAFPNRLRDYTCGTRTYDTAAGYNHRGIDYSLWPFPWQMMDDGAVDVVAVAPGILIEKRDGSYDRNCSRDAPDNANYVIILHGDGTIARYLHLKRNSVTTLPIGTPVAAGTVLGKVGSSGISSGPHLHLEIRASNSVNAPVIDPFNGQCNASATAWASQRPYRETRISRLSTHSSPPAAPVCPVTTDQPNLKDSFRPGEPITFLATYRDPARGLATQFRVLRPNGTVFSSWSFDMAVDDPASPPFYNGAYWYWSQSLPANAATGLWTLEATLEGRVSRHTFVVGTGTAPPDAAFPPELSGSWYNVATSGQGFNLELVNDRRFLLYFYGYGNSGEPLWLYGDYDPPGRTFGYGQPVDVPMYFVSGGNFSNFNPANVSSRVWGTARIRFDSCRRAHVELSGEAGTQVLALDKLLTPMGLGCPE